MKAHEFVHTQKIKRVTLSAIKDEYGKMFSNQLKETALIVQALGKVQCLDVDQHFFSTQTMQDIVCRLHCYSIELSNLIDCLSSDQKTRAQSVSAKQIIPELITTIGLIQQHVIDYLQDLLEDTGALFVRQHIMKLSDLVPKIKQYTQDLSTLHRLLIDAEKRQLAQKKETVIVKENV